MYKYTSVTFTEYNLPTVHPTGSVESNLSLLGSLGHPGVLPPLGDRWNVEEMLGERQ